MQHWHVAGLFRHSLIGSFSLRERARVRTGSQTVQQNPKHRIYLVLPPERWQTAHPFTPFVLRLYANVF